jgi:uncharacterized membrane-anchored protein
LTRTIFHGLFAPEAIPSPNRGLRDMKVRMTAGALALALAASTAPAGAQDGNVAVPPPALVAFERGLHKQTGDVAIPAAKAVLHLGQRYYFIGPAEAQQVITKVWGNPPGEAQGVLGMIFPVGSTTYDNVWGAVVTYQDSGYVPTAMPAARTMTRF